MDLNIRKADLKKMLAARAGIDEEDVVLADDVPDVIATIPVDDFPSDTPMKRGRKPGKKPGPKPGTKRTEKKADDKSGLHKGLKTE